jgi:iron-sulfur cluster repair protein YtfE (RIC family)
MEERMRATEELRSDHVALRAKLARMERLLRFTHGPQAPLREAAASLACRLSCHENKEEFLLALLQERLHDPAKVATHQLLEDHQGFSSDVTAILELLRNSEDAATEQLKVRLSRLISTLREHMALEEATVFPEIDRSLGTKPSGEANRLLHLIDRCYASEQRAAASEEMFTAAGQVG